MTTSAIITCATPDREWLFGITNPTKQAFSSKYNVPYIFKTDIYPDISYKPGWNKIPMINTYLPQYDLLCWMDDDAGIINPEVNFLQEIDNLMGSACIGICKDLNGINSGVVFIRNTITAIQTFKEIWENRHLYKEEHHGYPGTMEQPAIIDYINKMGEAVRILDGHRYNAYDPDFLISEPNQRTEATLILHICNGPGWKLEHKSEILAKFGQGLH